MAVMSVLPSIRALPFFNFIWPVFIFTWILISFLYSPSFFIKPNSHQLVTYLFFIYTISIAYIAGNGFIGNRYLEYSQIFVFYWAYRLSIKKGKLDDCLKLLFWLLPVIVTTSIITILAYASNSNISRTSKKDTLVGLEQMSQGIGGYEFIYFLVFILAPILYLLIDSKIKFSIIKRIFSYLLIGIFVGNIIFANFTTALILLIIIFIIKFMIPKLTSSKLAFYLILALILAPVLYTILLAVIEPVIDLLGSSMNAQRLIEIRELLAYGFIDSSLGARLNAFHTSLTAAMNNPVSGIIMSDLGGYGTALKGFGQHSFLLDTFALFGVVIGVISIYLYFQPLVKLYKIKSYSCSSLPLLMIGLSTIFFMVNNMAPSIGFAIYFVFPVIYSWTLNKLPKKNVFQKA